MVWVQYLAIWCIVGAIEGYVFLFVIKNIEPESEKRDAEFKEVLMQYPLIIGSIILIISMVFGPIHLLINILAIFIGIFFKLFSLSD